MGAGIPDARAAPAAEAAANAASEATAQAAHAHALAAMRWLSVVGWREAQGASPWGPHTWPYRVLAEPGRADDAARLAMCRAVHASVSLAAAVERRDAARRYRGPRPDRPDPWSTEWRTSARGAALETAEAELAEAIRLYERVPAG